MSEAYLATTRKRVSLARHARLVDYHLHEGNQASTWLGAGGRSPARRRSRSTTRSSWCGPARDAAARVGVLRQPRAPAAGGAAPALRSAASTGCGCTPGATRSRRCAPAAPAPTSCRWSPVAAQPEADALRDLVRNGQLRQMLIAERLNPLTGRTPGRNPRKRQLLRLRAGATGAFAAQTIHDPVTNTLLVRLHWRDEDALRFDYSFTTFCDGDADRGRLDVPRQPGAGARGPADGGVLPRAGHGAARRHARRSSTATSSASIATATAATGCSRALPEGPLAYLPTPRRRRGAGAIDACMSRSTLPAAAPTPGTRWRAWCTATTRAEQGDHFMVETDERRRSVLRFGNGTNGRLLPHGAVVHARLPDRRRHGRQRRRRSARARRGR